MKRLTKLSPAETLAMAICIEGANAARHSVWADRFRPYNEELSTILDGFAQEDRLSQKKLQNIYKEKYHKSPEKSTTKSFDEIVEKSNPDLEHFFVLDDEMSRKIMLSVLNSEYESMVFFQKAIFQNKDKGLKKIYQMLADYEKQHVNELKESLEHQKDSIRKSSVEEEEQKEDDPDNNPFFQKMYKNTQWRSRASEKK